MKKVGQLSGGERNRVQAPRAVGELLPAGGSMPPGRTYAANFEHKRGGSRKC